jgi:hypothetical protein
MEAPPEAVEAAPEAAPVIAYQAEPDAADLLWGDPEPVDEPTATEAPSPEADETDGGDDADASSSASDGEGDPATPDAPASDNLIHLAYTDEWINPAEMTPKQLAARVATDARLREQQSAYDKAEAQAKRGEKPTPEPAPQPHPTDARREKASGFIAAMVRSVQDTDGVDEDEATALVQEGLGSLLDLHREATSQSLITPARAAALARIEAEEAHRALVAEVASEAPQILKAYGVSDVTPAAFADALARMEAVRPEVEREAGRRLKDYEVHETALTLARENAKTPAPVTPKNSTEPKPYAPPIASKGVIPPAPKPKFILPSRPVTPGRPDAPRDDHGRFAPEEPSAADLLFG